MISDFNQLRRIYMQFPTPQHALVPLPFAARLVAEAEVFVASVLKRPYLAIHLRRTDFLHSEHTHGRVHSIKVVAAHARALMGSYRADIVFIATDADETDQEFAELEDSGLELHRYPTGRGLYPGARSTAQFSDGQVAVIEQIVCAQAAVFLGTARSAFSARIARDRCVI